jgi:hypothetical protein
MEISKWISFYVCSKRVTAKPRLQMTKTKIKQNQRTSFNYYSFFSNPEGTGFNLCSVDKYHNLYDFSPLRLSIKHLKEKHINFV